MLLAGITFGLFGYSQSVEQQIEKQMKDPQRKANAGKADVIISKNKNIFDSTTFIENAAKPAASKYVKVPGQKKRCGSKTKRSSKSGASKKQA
jgi:hypothetical protein